VLTHPEDQFHIVAVPAVAKMMGEETPFMVVVLVGEEDADSVVANGVAVIIVSPNYAKEERARGGHDGDVWHDPPTVVIWKRVDGLEEEWVAGDRAHGVVGNTSGCRTADPCWVGEERVEAAIASLRAMLAIVRASQVGGTYIVQVYVDSAKVVQHKVSYRVGALDRVHIAIKGLEKPWISSDC
jgi:hypothetical protein